MARVSPGKYAAMQRFRDGGKHVDEPEDDDGDSEGCFSLKCCCATLFKTAALVIVVGIAITVTWSA